MLLFACFFFFLRLIKLTNTILSRRQPESSAARHPRPAPTPALAQQPRPMSVQRAPQLQALQQEARTRPRSPLSPRNPNVTSHGGGGGKPSADSPLKPPGSTRSWIREMNNAVFTPAASSRLQRRVSSPASTKAGSSAHPATAAVDGAGNGKQLRFDSPVLATPTPSDASLRSAVKTPGLCCRLNLLLSRSLFAFSLGHCLLLFLLHSHAN